MTNDHDIRALNSLIATTIDSVDGYTEAAKESDDSRFVPLFTRNAQERRGVIDGLRAAVIQMGGTPEDDGTVLASAHRTFMDLKAAVTGRDDVAIVNEVERGEDHIKSKYEAALADVDLSPAARTAVTTAWQSVKSGHDEIRNLKQTMAA